MKAFPHVARDDDLDGAVEGVPAFRCRLTANGSWAFKCSCGQVHVHSAEPGHRAGHCATHRPHGYYLLPGDDMDLEAAA